MIMESYSMNAESWHIVENELFERVELTEEVEQDCKVKIYDIMRQDSEFFYREGPRQKFDRTFKVASYYASKLIEEKKGENPDEDKVRDLVSNVAAYFMIASIADRAIRNRFLSISVSE